MTAVGQYRIALPVCEVHRGGAMSELVTPKLMAARASTAIRQALVRAGPAGRAVVLLARVVRLGRVAMAVSVNGEVACRRELQTVRRGDQRVLLRRCRTVHHTIELPNASDDMPTDDDYADRKARQTQMPGQ